jgi:hypothetical protein
MMPEASVQEGIAARRRRIDRLGRIQMFGFIVAFASFVVVLVVEGISVLAWVAFGCWTVVAICFVLGRILLREAHRADKSAI